MSTAIVTALDPNFLWGAYLLIASLRYQGVKAPVHVLTYRFSPQDRDTLAQFPQVKIHDLPQLTWRYFNCLKPAAICQADADYITWMDADCIVTGDITPYLETQEESFSLRFRDGQEHLALYRSLFPQYYEAHSAPFPDPILARWRDDVGERQEPRIATTCSACCFTLHRRHLDFIRRWEQQMARVLPSIEDGQVHRKVVDWGNQAYRLTDEAVLNSLLAFAENSPNLSEYQLDKDPHAQLVHFATNPKPWEIWLPRYARYYDLVMDIIDWTQQQGMTPPPKPLALRRPLKPLNLLAGKACQTLLDLKHLIS